MSVIAEFTIRAPDLALISTLEAVPEMTGEDDSVALTERGSTLEPYLALAERYEAAKR